MNEEAASSRGQLVILIDHVKLQKIVKINIRLKDEHDSINRTATKKQYRFLV